MKQMRLGVTALTIAVAGLFAFKGVENGSIKGKVSPAEGASRAWALSSSDTLQTEVKDGAYEIKDAKAGVYRVIIEAKPPYKNAAKDNVTVTEGQAADAGEIKLEQ
ncbi:peptidase associated/transthyretin-like domain-containing protein [Flavitalea antarctica]